MSLAKWPEFLGNVPTTSTKLLKIEMSDITWDNSNNNNNNDNNNNNKAVHTEKLQQIGQI